MIFKLIFLLLCIHVDHNSEGVQLQVSTNETFSLDKATDQNLVHQSLMRSCPSTLLLFCPLNSIIIGAKELKISVSSSVTYIGTVWLSCIKH